MGPLQTSVDVKITRSPRLAFVVRNIETSGIQCQFDKVRELRTEPFLSRDSSLSCNVCINYRTFPVREIFVSNNLYVGEVAQGRANLSSYQVIVIVPWREESGGGEISALETSHFTHRPCLTGGRDHMEQEGGYKYSQISN